MEIQKELSQISWLVDEPTYRQDPALSYSNLSTFETLGFTGLDHLFDKKESPSLLVGSCIDCILTGGEEEFNSLYFVADFPSIGDKEKQITDYLFNQFSGSYDSIGNIPATYILDATNVFEFQKNWKDDTRVKVISERCFQYYQLKYAAGNKIIVDAATFENVKKCVRVLRESPATCGYFADNDEMSPIRRYYQLKFKFSHDGVDYRSMMDLVIVDYEKKKAYPIDLKSSLSCPEWEFEENFKKWHY